MNDNLINWILFTISFIRSLPTTALCLVRNFPFIAPLSYDLLLFRAWHNDYIPLVLLVSLLFFENREVFFLINFLFFNEGNHVHWHADRQVVNELTIFGLFLILKLVMILLLRERLLSTQSMKWFEAHAFEVFFLKSRSFFCVNFLWEEIEIG